MKKSLIIVYCMLILCSTLLVNAIGIGPPRTTISFEPNLEQDIEYYIVNNIDAAVNVELYIKGDLKEYITLEKTSLRLNPGKSEIVIAHLSLPERLNTPGTNKLRIGALSSPIGEGGGMVAAKAGVESQLNIEVPYEGKFLTANINVEDIKVGETAELIIEISNLGIEDISAISAAIDIYDSDDNKITTVSTDVKGLKAGENDELNAEFNTGNAKPGTYKAVASIDYDGNQQEVETSFNIGDVLIEIINLETNKFSPGDIAKFTLEIESKWNEKINNVYAVLEIYDSSSELIGNAESKKIEAPAQSKTNIDIFWDSTGITPGKYTVKSILHYRDKTSEKSFDIEVKKQGNIWIIILPAAIVLLIIYLMWFKWKKGTSKKKKR